MEMCQFARPEKQEPVFSFNLLTKNVSSQLCACSIQNHPVIIWLNSASELFCPVKGKLKCYKISLRL